MDAVRKHLVFFLLILVILMGTWGMVQFDHARHDDQVAALVQARLQAGAHALRADLRSLSELNERLAEALDEAPGQESQAFALWTTEILHQRPDILALSWVDHLRMRRVAPLKGNENIRDLDYSRHPEFMSGIRRMRAHRSTVLEPVQRLLQTGRPGLLVRSPMAWDAATSRYEGMMVLAVDWHDLLRRAGLAGADLPFVLQIRQQDDEGVLHGVHGPAEMSEQGMAQVRLELADQVWWLRAVPQAAWAYPATRIAWIWAVGLALALLVLGVWWRHSGGWRARRHRSPGDGLTSLRTFIVLAALVPLPIVAGLTGWWVYGASMRTVQQLQAQQIAALGAQMRDRLAFVLSLPSAVVTFNQGQWQSGLIDGQDSEAMLESFLLQLRAQPRLTLLAFVREDGRFWAASRQNPEGGSGLRILEADMGLDGLMRSYRVDDANQRLQIDGLGNQYVDLRAQPWFQKAMEGRGLYWNTPSAHATREPDILYQDWGLGMAAPVNDAQGQPVGVLMADVALTQISQLLEAEMARLAGVAWLSLPDGTLLAASSPAAVGKPGRDGFLYATAADSTLPLVRDGSAWIARSRESTGHHWMSLEGTNHLLHWQSFQLPAGPRVTLTLALPQDQYAGSADRIPLLVGFLVLGFWLVGILIALGVAWWFSRPLRALSRWAERLARDGHAQGTPVKSPVREIAVLSRALAQMTDRLQAHASRLEQLVAERTSALTRANARLQALSLTDALTGLANRRHFDQVLAKEWARAWRSREPLSLLMLDVDFFKAYNDHYGHQAGDRVLCQVADVLRASLQRPADLVARYGGEEFAVILPGQAAAEAERLAQRLRKRIQDLHIEHASGIGQTLTVSIGVAQMQRAPAAGVERLIQHADAALYQAKQAGRNCVMVNAQSTAPAL